MSENPGQHEFRVVCDIPFTAEQRERIVQASAVADIDFRPAAPASEVRDLSEAQVLVSHWPPEDWGLASHLQWMQTDSAGVDYLAGNKVWQSGITVTNAAGAYAPQIAQYVLGYVLAQAEKHRDRSAAQRETFWPSSDVKHLQLIGDTLRGQVIVIVGYGGTGRETARLAHAFGMRIIALKASPAERRARSYCLPGTGDPDGVIPEEVLGIHDLSRLAHTADYLVIALPATTGTRHVVDRSVLDALQPSACLINVGRGAAVDQAALTTALQDGLLQAAVLDVFEEEPLAQTSTLWTNPRATITPHIAGGGATGRELFSHLLAENLRRYGNREALINVVDPARHY